MSKWKDIELTAKGVDLLRQAQEAIKSNPTHFDMDYWFSTNGCGTTACVAGWVCTLDNASKLKKNLKPDTQIMRACSVVSKAQREDEEMDTASLALKLLSGKKTDATSWLFHIEDWPDEIWRKYNQAERQSNYDGMAKAACEAIDLYIKHNYKETKVEPVVEPVVHEECEVKQQRQQHVRVTR